LIVDSLPDVFLFCSFASLRTRQPDIYLPVVAILRLVPAPGKTGKKLHNKAASASFLAWSKPSSANSNNNQLD
jgi:hypothetical protein